MRKPGGQIELRPGEEERIYKHKMELTELEREERLLDTHLKWMKQSIRNVCESQDNYKLAYTTQEELLAAFSESTVFAVQAPPGTCVEISPVAKVIFENLQQKKKNFGCFCAKTEKLTNKLNF